MNVANWRKWAAAALAASLCLFGATARVDAAANNSAKKTVPSWGKKSTDHPKLDRKLNDRALAGGSGKSRVIVELVAGKDVSGDAVKAGAKRGMKFGLINGELMEVPNGQLKKLADSPAVKAMHWDRPTGGEMNRAAVIEGARAVQAAYGYDGAGVGVAVIDSGVTSWHDDLTYNGFNSKVKVVNGQRVTKFVDFVNGQTTPYDDNGHGTHVAGIIAGNGYDTLGLRAGIAPAANIVSLKVLDSHGGGYISNAIAALDWVLANGAAYNVRVVNLSVGAAVTESYSTDPLAQAAKRVVDSGIVVVCAAGNLGRSATGKTQYGGITAPGNAPWVLTVGAYTHQGTITRTDDAIALYSSRGPTAIDFGAKPDIVATGTGIVSLSVVGSTLYNANPSFLLSGSLSPLTKPYLSLTGTSMAAPIVTGTVALMLQANPKLTPNLVKGILEYTSQRYDYNSLTQGAGFLNSKGAVDLAKFFYAPRAGQVYPHNALWSRTLIWGNHKIRRGVLKPAGSAWATNTVWGANEDGEHENIVWGTNCPALDPNCDSVIWGTSDQDRDNMVWGTYNQAGGGAVWGTTECPAGVTDLVCDNIVWFTSVTCTTLQECDNIVWGTECGQADCDNIVWGTSATCTTQLDCDNIVWGTTEQCTPGLDCDNIVWGTSATCPVNEQCANVVWGSAGTVGSGVWGSNSDPNNVTWGCTDSTTALFDDPLTPASFADVTDIDGAFTTLGGDDATTATPPTTTTTPPTAIIGLLASPPLAIVPETYIAAEWSL